MGHREDPNRDLTDLPAPHPAPPVHDRHWVRDVRGAIGCAGVLLALLLLLDSAAGTLTAWRAVLWAVLALLLLAVLCPSRISAGEGWIVARSLLRSRRVRTDLLVSVSCLDGVSQRLLLRDAFGDRFEIDPRVLMDNPELWRRLDEDARRAEASGFLLCGTTALSRLSARIDAETAHTVFKVSGLD
ncbi:hypothetical protein ACIP2X_14915 [Streptomyces sp. NPDC089424]|uniref:hypothetical protein n=1 Tax=Streptomyces sp. NPDC089424 TaxID=3365917 RepID=UPI0037F9A540